MSDEVNQFARWMKRNQRDLGGRVAYRMSITLAYEKTFGEQVRFFFNEDSQPLKTVQWWRNG